MGDNGVITNAMNAKTKNGIAILEEFLQEKYVELYDDIKDEDNKVLSLINNSSTSKYFYKPDVGALQYIVDSEGHALYLINKDNLPNLQYFGIMGYLIIDSVPAKNSGYTEGGADRKSENTITKVDVLNNFTSKTKEAIKYLFLNNNDITSFVGIEEFTNLYLVRLEHNKVEDLKGLENKKNLKYVIANNNLLGNSEVYNLEQEDNGKNPILDSLSFLSSCSNLYYLNIESNNIRWTEYLSNLPELKIILIDGNLNLADVLSIKRKIFECSKYSINSKYSLDLLDEEKTTVLDLQNYTLSLSKLETISNCKNLTVLRLDNVKLTDNSDKLLDNDLINSNLNETLKELSKMSSLSLIGINGLTSIDFIDNMPNIKELDLRKTQVINLEKLNYKKNLASMRFDNASVDLKSIQSAISTCAKNYGNGTSYFGGYYTRTMYS